MVTDTTVPPPSVGQTLSRVRAATRGDDLLAFDALALSEQVLEDHMPANMILVGAAFQQGCLPLSQAAIHEAIRLNGAAVEDNLLAFAWGRAAAIRPDAVLAAARNGHPPDAGDERPRSHARRLDELAEVPTFNRGPSYAGCSKSGSRSSSLIKTSDTHAGMSLTLPASPPSSKHAQPGPAHG